MIVLPKSLNSNNNFLSEKIKKSIFESLKKFKSVKFSDPPNQVEIFSLGEKPISELEKARTVYQQVYILSKRLNNQDKRPILSYIYLVDAPKELDGNKDNITSTECNSASTTFYSDYLEIVIWRKEEWLKVFYHELIHAFNLDKIIIKQDIMKEMRLKQLFPHYNNSLYEAYAEILATVLYINNIYKLNDGFYTRYIEKWKDQNIFMGSQVNKIVQFMTHHSNTPNKNNAIQLPFGKSIETFDSNIFFRNPKKLLDNSTNTCSYYILKSIYLWRAIYKDTSLLHMDNLMNKEFIQNHFYDVFINTLECNEYIEWLNKIYFYPKNQSLRLTLT